MNLISYRGMPLMVLYSNPWVREVVLDESGTSYLWTKWILSSIVTYNPQAVSFLQRNIVPGGGGDNLNRPPSPTGLVDPDSIARMPANTDIAIRRFLEYPRGQLIVWSMDDARMSAPDQDGQGQIGPRRDGVRAAFAGNPPNLAAVQGIVVLRSPAVGMPCDANNGPICKVNSIQEIAGERLWQIHLTFETTVYEDSLATTGSTPPLIVSNRWSMATDTNWQHLTMRVIEGIVHVRADQLAIRDSASRQNQIDSLRQTFAAFTVPPGFQRESVQVRVMSDGNQAAYRIVDAEQLMQKATSTPAVRVEVEEASWMQRGSVGRGVSSLLNNNVAPNGIGPVTLFNWAISRMQQVGSTVVKQLPSRYKTVIVRVWGSRNHRRVAMTTLGIAIARQRMGTAFLIDTTTAETIVRYSSGQNMVEVQTTSRWNFNDFGSLVVNGFNVIPNLFDPATSPGVGDVGLGNFISQDADMQSLFQSGPNLMQPAFPNDGGTRGTWGPPLAAAPLDILVTQTLESIGQAPAAPP